MSIAPVLVYDGDCGFCSRSVQLLSRWAARPVRVVPWQRAPLPELGLTAGQVRSAAWLVTADGRSLAGPEALAEWLRPGGRAARTLAALLDQRPLRAIAWRIYRWVARHRHRLPGSTGACRVVPAPLPHTPVPEPPEGGTHRRAELFDQ